MDPINVSAQFAAYIWFLNQHQDDFNARREAGQYAKENAHRFETLAHQGLGRLLLKLADQPLPRVTARRPSQQHALAG